MAQALVMSGSVLAGERRVEKPSDLIDTNAELRLKGASQDTRFVGRGGLKLQAALDEFHICPRGYVCLDVGSSTGGFTDCLLQNGASRITAVDAGTNQLDWKLRSDPRVDVREKFNARYATPSDLPGPFDLIVMDVSFISVRLIIPALTSLMHKTSKLIVLVKPQFEVGRGEVGKGGIVKDPALHQKVLSEVNDFAAGAGLEVLGQIDSPILGAEGNKEFLVLYGLKQ
jgi:23S rRNA (cytidine1920-2'-O)/16S rRNA (cytidine1409-2'-O)-methyltransferase